MDYSNAGGVKIMKPIATGSGCSYVPFGQMKLIGEVETKMQCNLDQGHGGICYGLSVAWLEAMHKSADSAAFVADVSDFSNSAMFYRAYSSYRHQKTYKDLNSGTMNGTNWAARDPFFGDGAIEQNNILSSTKKSNTYDSSLGSLKELTEWICASAGKRYFMLSIPGHAMAATGSKMGYCSFFDPNAGIIYSMSKDKVAKCMFDFFSNATLKKLYQTSNNRWLTATKYK